MESGGGAWGNGGLALPGEGRRNFSSHFFRQKPMGVEWGCPFPGASSRRTAEHSREKIVTVEAPVLRFACRKHRRTNRKWRSSGCGGRQKLQKNKCLFLLNAKQPRNGWAFQLNH